MTFKDVVLTKKIHKKLKETANEKGVPMEALGNILLMLSLCDNSRVNLVVNLIKNWNFGGATDLETKGL